MKKFSLFFIVLGVVLIIIHGTFPIFIVDYITIIIYLIICIPFLFDYLEIMVLPGGIKLHFRKKMTELKTYFDKNEEYLRNLPDEKTKKMIMENKMYRTFDFSLAENLINIDTSLAMASIRMEIERKLGLAHSILIGGDKKNRESLRKIIDQLKTKKVLVDVQVNLLLDIISICNLAVHGIDIKKEDAIKVLNISEELNSSFNIGYSICFEYNKKFEEHGLACPWEHCIEYMPIFKNKSKKSCPVFGHDCPGGKKQVDYCKK